jgi:hypothetical protein
VKNHEGRLQSKTSSVRSPGKNDEYFFLTTTHRRSGRRSMPFRQDPPWDARNLTGSSRRDEIARGREGRYAAPRSMKNHCSFHGLSRSAQFGMDARPNPVLPPFRLRRRLSGLGIFADDLYAKSPHAEQGVGVVFEAFVTRHLDKFGC